MNLVLGNVKKEPGTTVSLGLLKDLPEKSDLSEDTDTEPREREPDAAQWIPPGTSVTIQGFTLPEGMVYVGRKLTSIKGETREPALIDPGLRTIYRVDKGKSPFDPYEDFYNSPDYYKFSGEKRGHYLHWLASRRQTPGVSQAILLLFLFGIERRLLGHLVTPRETAPTPAEQQTLVAALRELTERYTGYGYATFRGKVSALFDFLELKALFTDSTAALPDARRLAKVERQYASLPTMLEIGLSVLARSRQPLPADYAWAWIHHDPETNPRTAVRRCPEEAQALFIHRYPEKYPKGIKLTSRKSTIYYTFRPASPSFKNALNPSPTKEEWYAVGKAPLGRLRVLVDQVADELDGYSRWVLKNEGRPKSSLSGAAYLPAPLFESHATVSRLKEWLTSEYAKRPNNAPVTPLSLAALRHQWNGETGTLSRNDTVNLHETLERCGWCLEPDVRYNGASLNSLKENATVLLAPLLHPIPARGEVTVVPRAFACLALLVAASEPGELTPERVLPLLPLLPPFEEDHLPRLTARAYYLCAQTEERKLPRKEAFAEIQPSERTPLLEAIVRMTGPTITPARTKELVKIVKLIGAEENDLYTLLHAQQTMPAVRTRPDGFVTVQTGTAPIGFTLPAPNAKRTRVASKSAEQILDHSLIRQKQEETERVTSLLSTIFSEEAPALETTSPPPTPATVPAEKSSPRKVSASIMLQHIARQSAWEADTFAAYARTSGWLPNAAREAINDLAFERCGDALLVGEDPIEVMTDLLPELLEDVS